MRRSWFVYEGPDPRAWGDNRKQLSVRLELKWEDLWVGVFWKRTKPRGSEVWPRSKDLDVWICILPCLPLHLRFRELAP